MDNTWPPEFDGIKIADQKILARVKNTDIWLEIDLNNPFWRKHFKSSSFAETLVAWLEAAL